MAHDDELMRQVQARDAGAFDALARRHAHGVADYTVEESGYSSSLRFAEAAARGEVDPLTDPHVRLLVGLRP